ncbi:MAG: hypothetical protein DRJ03_18255 [Chloroflexi bacterium]|nr:MAG: hypothetical protein DRJ03_18255 [Chloroflexota bacterium]
MPNRTMKKNPRPKDPVTGKFVQKNTVQKELALANIDVDNLPTKFRTAEELRGYILKQTDGGADIIKKLLKDLKTTSKRVTPAVQRDIAKMLMEMLIPDAKQTLQMGLESPDGKFVFKWANETGNED